MREQSFLKRIKLAKNWATCAHGLAPICLFYLLAHEYKADTCFRNFFVQVSHFHSWLTVYNKVYLLCACKTGKMWRAKKYFNFGGNSSPRRKKIILVVVSSFTSPSRNLYVDAYYARWEKYALKYALVKSLAYNFSPSSVAHLLLLKNHGLHKGQIILAIYDSKQEGRR